MRRRTIQAVVAAAFVVSAQAFSTPPATAGSCAHGRATMTSSSDMQTRVSSSLSMIDQAEKVSEFDLQVGRALDTLKTDYPQMLKRNPDYTIYDPDLLVVDPSGFTLHGIRNYRQAFNLVHGIINVFYCPEKSLLTFRIVYDCTRHNIRVSWNAEVVPKAIFGGVKTTLHVDGISVYDLGDNGKVVQHRVEHLMINDTPVETEKGIFDALKATCADPDCGIPVFYRAEDERFIARFQMIPSLSSSLFDAEKSLTLHALSASSSGGPDGAVEYPGLDREAMESKNRSRAKFGLKPLTPEEFLEVEAKVKQMEIQELSKQQSMTSDASEVPQKKPKKNGFLSNIFGETFEDTCESNYDCKRPQICCDFGFKKMCCSSGAMVGQMQPVRIPIKKEDGFYNGY